MNWYWYIIVLGRVMIGTCDYIKLHGEGEI